MKVCELIEMLQKCNPNAIVCAFTYDREMGIDIECVSPNGKFYKVWDKYEVIRYHISNGKDVVVLSDFDLEKKFGYCEDEDDEDWDD